MNIRCHEGMYTAACMLLDDTYHMIEHWMYPQKYSLTICGHSLGAGVSCLLGVMIKNKLPNLKLHVYAYATPSCLSLSASVECKHYITSVVNNNDIVPRMSLLNVRLLNQLLNLLDEKLSQRGLSPTDFTTAKAYLTDLMTIDTNLLLTPTEICDFLQHELVDNAIFKLPTSEEGKRDDDDTAGDNNNKACTTNPKLLDCEIFVPGRVVSIWNNRTVGSSDNGDAGGDENTATDPIATENGSTIPIVGGRALDGTMHVVRTIFLETDIISDHMIPAYRTNLQKLQELMTA